MWVQSLGWEDQPGGRYSNPLQYSCLENPTDRGGWRATVHRIAKSRTRLRRLNKQARSITGPCSTYHSPDAVYPKLFLSNLLFCWVLTRRPWSSYHHSFHFHSKKRKPSLAEFKWPAAGKDPDWNLRCYYGSSLHKASLRAEIRQPGRSRAQPRMVPGVCVSKQGHI